MKKNTLILLLLLVGSMSFAQTTIEWDNSADTNSNNVATPIAINGHFTDPTTGVLVNVTATLSGGAVSSIAVPGITANTDNTEGTTNWFHSWQFTQDRAESGAANQTVTFVFDRAVQLDTFLIDDVDLDDQTGGFDDQFTLTAGFDNCTGLTSAGVATADITTNCGVTPNNSNVVINVNDGAGDYTASFTNGNTVATTYTLQFGGTLPNASLTFTLAATLLNTDTDGIPDFTDLDDDNDGIPDSYELCGTAAVPLVLSADIGINIDLDRFENETSWTLADPIGTIVASGGTYANGDDIIAANYTARTNGTYVFTIYDSVGDGISNNTALLLNTDENRASSYNLQVNGGTVFASAASPNFGSQDVRNIVINTINNNPFSCFSTNPMLDDDNDGVVNYKDPDFCTLNANGVCISMDTDGDGIPNHLDLDSDNDGILDVDEGGNGALDTNGDGMIDSNDAVYADANNDGQADGSVDANEEPDTDGDGIADYKDLDSDNDGINDTIEGGNNASDTNGDGMINSSDTGGGDADGDGISDSVDGNTSIFGDAGDPPHRDTDGDGIPDSQDLDSDDDGINDVTEAGNNAADTDGNGVVDGPDTDGDGIQDGVDQDPGNFGDMGDINTPPNDVSDPFDANSGGTGVLSCTGTDVDGDGIPDCADSDTNVFGEAQAGQLAIKVMLQGALLNSTGDKMRTDLAANGYVPLAEPYSTSGRARFTTYGSGGGETTTLAILDGNLGTDDAIVDWVFVELRDATDNTIILETRAALLQRDGDVVDEKDGISPISIPETSGTAYYVVIKHRNHLGAMFANTISLSTTPVTVDFTTATGADLYDKAGAIDYNNAEQITVGGVQALHGGNANADNQVGFSNGTNDFGAIQIDALLHPDNTTYYGGYDFGFGYFSGDVNMDGKVSFTASNSDASQLQIMALLYPLNTTYYGGYDFIIEQLP
jgi:hypothetical protein